MKCWQLYKGIKLLSCWRAPISRGQVSYIVRAEQHVARRSSYTSCLEIHISPPQAGSSQTLDALALALGFCLADESNVPWSWSRRAGLLVRTGCQAEIVYVLNHRDWCSLSFPLLFFFSSLLPSCCRPSQTGSRPRSLPRHNWISSPLFFVFLLLATLPLLTDTEMTNVYPLERLRRPLSVKTRQLDKLVAVHPSGPALELLWMNLTASKREQRKNVK